MVLAALGPTAQKSIPVAGPGLETNLLSLSQGRAGGGHLPTLQQEQSDRSGGLVLKGNTAEAMEASTQAFVLQWRRRPRPLSGRSCCLALPTIHQHSKPNQTAVTEPAGHMLLLNPRPASPVGGRPCTCLHRRAAGTLSSCWPLGRVTWALFPLASVLSVLWNCHRRLLLFAEHTQQRFRQFASRLSQNCSACQMGRYNHVAVHLFALSPHAFFPPPQQRQGLMVP